MLLDTGNSAGLVDYKAFWLLHFQTAIAKISPLCAVSVRAAVLGLVMDDEAGDVVERIALG